jgi:hypothetical protein
VTDELITNDQAEDAAATAMALLLEEVLTRRRPDRPAMEVYPAPLAIPWPDLVAACRVLLRGPVAEDLSRRPGGYCMRAPEDPQLYALGRLGAHLVELSYTSRNATRARVEAMAAIREWHNKESEET